MRFKTLETVVLDRDLPEHGLRKGDLGTVVQLYETDAFRGLEVEFVSASGRTEAFVTLEPGLFTRRRAKRRKCRWMQGRRRRAPEATLTGRRGARPSLTQQAPAVAALQPAAGE
jgi:hypothetical protein